MPESPPPSPNGYDHAAVSEALDNIIASLGCLTRDVIYLKSLLVPEAGVSKDELNPRDPANKHEVGGLMKLTAQGVEVCYRLFDAGKSRYAVATMMDISFGAANHRYEAWKKFGGVNRTKQPLG